MINCLIADDHWIVRKGLVFAIEQGFDNFIFDEASTVDEVLEKLRINKYDIIFLDFFSPDLNVSTQIENIRKLAGDSKIVIFTSDLNYVDFFTVKDFVQGILSKQSSDNRIKGAIKFVLNNYKNFFLGLNQEMFQKINTLSDRELEVAILFSKGMGNKEIVWKLAIKETTVSTIRKRIFDKLDISNNVELANYFWRSVL
ncbi:MULTISPECIES: response regulator transcription factor [Flavobacterium]|nr:response regulator transcription factor [Flavobacterium sp. N1846]